MIIYTDKTKKEANELALLLNESLILAKDYNNEKDEKLILISTLDNKKADKDIINFINNYDNFDVKYIANIIITDKKFHYGHFYIEKAIIKNSFMLSYSNNLNNNIKEIANDIKDEKYKLDKNNFIYSLTYKLFG